VGADEQAYTELDGLQLSFDLVVNAEDFALRTDLSALVGLRAPTFRHAPDTHALQPGPGAVALPPDVLARVEITGIASSWLRRPHRFALSFAARPVHWAYYLLPRQEGEAPSIRHAGDTGLQFQSQLLTSSDTGLDPLLTGLLRRARGKGCHRLLSAQPLSSAPLSRLSLYRGEREVISALPHPSFRDHTRLVPASQATARDALYCVVEE
jgi:hypothetical protein